MKLRIRTGWLRLKKTAIYEIDYLRRRFGLVQAFISILFLAVLIIISLDGTQAFFLGENSPIPDSWKILKDKSVIRVISIVIIASSYLLPWLSGFITNQRQTNELAVAVEENLIPAIQIELESLKARIKKKFHLSNSVRLSIFVPVRQGLCKWSFQMVCRTKNISERELLARFQLDEGVVGYTFLKNRKHCIEFIDVSDASKLPVTYRPLSQDNSTLINRDIQTVLVAAAFQEGSVAGLLAIDTSNIQDILKMVDTSLHDDALDWIISRGKTVRLLWRMKNNV